MLCFVAIDNHVIELSKVTHIVGGSGPTVVVFFEGGSGVEIPAAGADALFRSMDQLRRGAHIALIDARSEAEPKPPPPPPPPPVQLDLIPPVAPVRKPSRRGMSQKAGA